LSLNQVNLNLKTLTPNRFPRRELSLDPGRFHCRKRSTHREGLGRGQTLEFGLNECLATLSGSLRDNPLFALARICSNGYWSEPSSFSPGQSKGDGDLADVGKYAFVAMGVRALGQRSSAGIQMLANELRKIASRNVSDREISNRVLFILPIR